MLDPVRDELYGPWAPMWPRDAAALFRGYSGAWWVGGGYAIDAALGVERPHRDIDIVIPRAELPLFRGWIGSSYHAWSAFGGALKPLLPSDSGVLPAGCNQIWLRRDAYSPWEFEVILDPSDVETNTWRFRRDVSVTVPLDEALFHVRGIRYLRPQFVLAYLASRSETTVELSAALPALDAPARSWLADRLPADHAWRPLLIADERADSAA